MYIQWHVVDDFMHICSRILNLSSNALLWFDYAFIPRSLEVLDIHANNIDSLGNFYALRDYNNLKYIDASVNAISSLNVLSILPGVVEINLSNNTVSHIAPKTFTGKKHLKKIHLERNRLEKLDEASLMVTLGPNNRKLIICIGEQTKECKIIFMLQNTVKPRK